jgi:predicted  nucleic acid-binding Zn-ribbon protein
MENFLVPVSPGEVLDKITILEIKSERMSDPEKVANVRAELEHLNKSWADAVIENEVMRSLRQQLKTINQRLWIIEDDIRDKERAREFDEEFIQLARSVYATNDRRAQIKKEINLHLGAQLVEEKSYTPY